MAHDISIRIKNPLSSTSKIDRDWFGAVQTGFNKFEGFEAQSDYLGVSSVRWPGGTLSETKWDVYSLTNPDIFDGRKLYNDFDPDRDRPGLSDMLEYCRDENASFTMILPTARYATNVQKGISDLKSFLVDLYGGKFGALPKDFTLEIGNEYAFLDAFRDNPEAYGRIANAFVRTIKEVQNDARLNPDDADVNIGVQIGYSHSDDRAIRGAFSGNNLAEIDTLIFHSHPISLNNLHRESDGPDVQDRGESRVERYDDYLEAWQKVIRAHGGREAEIAMTEWSVGNSALAPDGLDLDYQDYGLRGVSALLDQLAAYSAIGVDSAAIWGVDVHNLSYFTKEVNGKIVASHTGTAFKMFSDALQGLTLLGGYSEQSRDQKYMTYSFGSDSEVVVYVIANDIRDSGETVELAIDGFASLEIENVTTIRSANAGSNGASRLKEVAIVKDQAYGVTKDGLRLDFKQDYQLIQIEFDIADGADPYSRSGDTSGLNGSDKLTGTAAADVLNGRLGNDEIAGWRGNDVLIGGGGADSVFGNEGNDTINGGNGNDRLLGNLGRDKLIGGLGDDVIDGGDGADLIVAGRGADNLIGGAGDDEFRLSPGDVFAAGASARNASSDNKSGTGEVAQLDGYARYHSVIDGRAGHDTVAFGASDDAVFLHDADSGFHAGLRLTRDSHGADSMARLSNLESVRMGGGDDLLDLTSTDYDLAGKSIRIHAGAGDDIIWGSAANETIMGGDGDDKIAAGAGRDVLCGGAGADTFQFTATSRNVAIRDYDPTEGDRIEIFGTDGAWISDTSAAFRSGDMVVSYRDAGTGRDHRLTIDIRLDGDARDLSADQIAQSLDFM